MTTVVLEGDAIEPLLARVASEHGPGARVVRAEKVRVGGVAGFFAKERFELVVEVDDEDDAPAVPAPGPTPAPAAPPTALPRPAQEDAVNGRDQLPGAAGSRRDEVLDDLFDSPIARALVRSQALDEAGATGAAPAAGGLDALLAAADAQEAASAHAPASAPVPPTVPAQGEMPGARAARGRHADPGAPAPSPGRPVSTESAAFAAVLDAVRDAAEPDHETAPPAPAPSATAEDDVPTGPEPVPAGAAVAELMQLLTARRDAAPVEEPVDEQAEEPVVEPVAAAAPASAPDLPPAPAPAPSQAPAAGRGALHEQLAAAGLPEHLLAALPAEAGAADVHGLLASLPGPAPLPARDGDLVVVVGAPRDALGVAQTVAGRLGVGPQQVVVAARPGGTGALRGDVVRDAAAARRAAATVRLGDAPGVVVVQADCDADDVRWAAAVLVALQADQVHVVVDATRKPRDTERWLEGVAPGAADVLHVVRAGGTSDPGTPLGLDLPVATVDGGPAGAGTWMSLLLPSAPPADVAPAARRLRPERGVAW
ncbi:hypothetical protein [Pseudokineococcus lusitanus]|uniref:Uncharacterized protein n=1 Tax=Pseudokineococcus lusitanus TaxID=763993 RepID=A0A3N1HQV8_9ACTN|nr:hypothetical protein [Pseudokineococcus lusitanus]ROP44816.1 hypothetical protein EDC03_0946 [Pseudokineococcus lusitanus]